MSELDRTRWRCRRGMLELDIVLARFIENRLAGMDPAQQAAFSALLECADNDLWDLIVAKTEARDERLKPVVAALRTV